MQDNECPTCGNTGEFKFQGKIYSCPDDDYGHFQNRLLKTYMLANVPQQFISLDWNDFPYTKEKSEIDAYLDQFQKARMLGMGWTFCGGLGVGKSWAGAHILMEVVKQGYDGWFADFREIRSNYEHPFSEEKKWNLSRIRECECLFLDEIVPPFSENSHGAHADKLEDIIRFRTNNNLPTICTTNMTEEEFQSNYPRVYSLLSAKQYIIELKNKDARIDTVWKFNHEILINGEARPIV